VTGQGYSKFFASSNGNATYGQVALPALVAPNTVPIGFVQLGTSALWASQQAYPFGQGESYMAGQLYFALTITAGSPDVGSPAEYLVDPYTLFLVAADTYELP
jgi:hypothetical protein